MSRYDLTDFEWRVIEPLLLNKPRGAPVSMTGGCSTASSGITNSRRAHPVSIKASRPHIRYRAVVRMEAIAKRSITPDRLDYRAPL